MNQAETAVRDRFPEVYDTIADYHERFVNKPTFVFGIEHGCVFAIREDMVETPRAMMARVALGGHVGQRLTVSHHAMDVAFAKGPETFGVSSVTAHDVFLDYGGETIVKTGNPDISNAAFDFRNALEIKYFRGVIEMEVPVGFMFHLDRPWMDGVFYKYIPGENLDRMLRRGNRTLANIMLWEVAKLFSRLIDNHVFFYDSDRFNNFYIENDQDSNCAGQHVLRLLDGEFIFPRHPLTDAEREYMIKRFARAALHAPSAGLSAPLLDVERLEDFLTVSLGDVAMMEAYRNSMDRAPDVKAPCDYGKRFR